MSNLEGYKFADVKDCCQGDISALENTIRDRSNRDIILIAYERK